MAGSFVGKMVARLMSLTTFEYLLGGLLLWSGMALVVATVA